jgi:uncharacterized OB-fold protein
MESERNEDLSPFLPGIFTPPPYDQAPPRLLGGFCPDCRTYFFPRSRFCPHCLGVVEETELGSEGTLYSFTVIRTKPPLGLPQPYSVGYVDLEEKGLRIFCLLDPGAIDRLRIGLPMQLAVGPLGHDGRGKPCLRPYFTIQEDQKI